MNYIKQLEHDNKELRARQECALAEIQEFMAFLNSPKFVGTENGERKDWIATGDVMHKLQDLRSAVQGMA